MKRTAAETDATRFAAWLNAAMVRREMRQSDLARRLGVSDTTVMRWRRGAGGIEFSNLRQLASLFHVSVEHLADLTRSPANEAESESGATAHVTLQDVSERDEYLAFWDRMLDRVPHPLWGALCDAVGAIGGALVSLSQAAEVAGERPSPLKASAGRSHVEKRRKGRPRHRLVRREPGPAR